MSPLQPARDNCPIREAVKAARDMGRQNNNIYIIDPDEAVHDALTELLVAAGMRVQCFSNAEDFLRFAESRDLSAGCFLTEANLPGMGSLAFLRQLHQRGFTIPVVVLTSTANRDIIDQALKAGAVEVIPKPLSGDRLLNFLNSLVRQDSERPGEQKGQKNA